MMSWAFPAALSCLYLAQATSLGFDSGIDVRITRLLQPRQLPSTLPPECQSTCNSVNNQISAGCTFAACCTSQFETGYFDCFKCFAQAINVTDFTVPQQTIDAVLEECAQRGLAIPKLTFPGQDPNRPLATLPLSSQSATGSNTNSPTMSISIISQSTVSQVSSLSQSASKTSNLTATAPSITSSVAQTSSPSATLSSNTASAAQTSSPSSSTRSITYNLFWAVLSTLLVGYLFLPA